MKLCRKLCGEDGQARRLTGFVMQTFDRLQFAVWDGEKAQMSAHALWQLQTFQMVETAFQDQPFKLKTWREGNGPQVWSLVDMQSRERGTVGQHKVLQLSIGGEDQ